MNSIYENGWLHQNAYSGDKGLIKEYPVRIFIKTSNVIQLICELMSTSTKNHFSSSNLPFLIPNLHIELTCISNLRSYLYIIVIYLISII